MSPNTTSTQRGTEVFVSSNGPDAHEDLTIAETLELMCDSSQSRPGERCYIRGNGQQYWISEDQVERFTSYFGALHPSDYEAVHGNSWELRFFSGF